MPKTEIEVKDVDGVEIHFHYKKKSTKQLHIFNFMGIGVKTMRGPNELDALDIISEFNKQEQFLLKIVNLNFNRSNLNIKITKKNYSSADKQKLTLAIKSWIDKGLLKRIQRERYMINPYFFTPPPGEHQTFLNAWNKL